MTEKLYIYIYIYINSIKFIFFVYIDENNYNKPALLRLLICT